MCWSTKRVKIFSGFHMEKQLLIDGAKKKRYKKKEKKDQKSDSTHYWPKSKKMREYARLGYH